MEYSAIKSTFSVFLIICKPYFLFGLQKLRYLYGGSGIFSLLLRLTELFDKKRAVCDIVYAKKQSIRSFVFCPTLKIFQRKLCKINKFMCINMWILELIFTKIINILIKIYNGKN